MAWVPEPKLLETVVLGIVRREDNEDGAVYEVSLAVNGAHYVYDVTLHGPPAIPGTWSGRMQVFEPLKTCKWEVARVVKQFAAGAPLTFPIDLGDLGSPEAI